MAIINISFGYVGGRANNAPPLFREVETETKAAAVASSQTTAKAGATSYGVNTAAVRIYTDTAIWVEFGANPTAAANTSMYLPAGAIEFFYADINDKVAVLEA